MKTQMKFQKILTLVSLIFAALTIVYSFFFYGGMLYEIRFYAVDQYDVPGSKELKDFSQSANSTLVVMCIVLLLCVVLLYLTLTNKRRKYYITNYIAIGVTVVYSVALAIAFFVIIGQTFALCAKVDLNAWKTLYEAINDYGQKANPDHYSTSKVTLIIGIVVAVATLVMATAWVLNTVWKLKLMQGEKALLQGQEIKEAA